MTERTIGNNRLIDGEKLDNFPPNINEELAKKQNQLVAGANITIVDTPDGKATISSTGGGGGTSDYNGLINKPRINSKVLTGNLTGEDLDLQNLLVSGNNIKTINGMTILGSGNIDVSGGQAPIITAFKDVYVNKDATYDGDADGTVYRPYKTVQSAIDNAPFGTNIKIAEGTYTENLVFTDKQNCTLIADGTLGQYRTVINGTVTINGTSKRLGAKNLSFYGIVTLNNSDGLIYTDNCNVGGFVITSNVTGYVRFDNSFIGGNLVHSGAGQVDCHGCQFENEGITTLDGTGLLNLTNCDLVTLAHHSGLLLTRGYTSFVGNSTQSEAIFSDADNGVLFLIGGTALKQDGTGYDRINKTGNCPYMLSGFTHEPTIDAFTGTKIDGGFHLEDIYSHYSPVNYTTLNAIANSHLAGIDEALGNLPTFDDLDKKTSKLIDLGSVSGTQNIDWSTGTGFILTLVGNTTLTFSGYTIGDTISLTIYQDGTGNRTLTLPVGMRYPEKGSFAQTTTASSKDIHTIYYDGTFNVSSLLNW